MRSQYRDGNFMCARQTKTSVGRRSPPLCGMPLVHERSSVRTCDPAGAERDAIAGELHRERKLAGVPPGSRLTQ